MTCFLTYRGSIHPFHHAFDTCLLTALLYSTPLHPQIDPPDQQPGDFKFDPLGFAKDEQSLKKLQLNELKNGRLAMVRSWAVVICPLPFRVSPVAASSYHSILTIPTTNSSPSRAS